MAQTPQSEEPAIVVYSMWAGDGVCSEQNTAVVALEDLLRDRTKYNDSCVSTVGFVGFRSLFALAEDAAAPESSWNTSFADRRVGLYGSDETMKQLAGVRRARIVGKLWDCSRFAAANIIMVAGYCHYAGGPFVSMASVEQLQGTIEAVAPPLN